MMTVMYLLSIPFSDIVAAEAQPCGTGDHDTRSAPLLPPLAHDARHTPRVSAPCPFPEGQGRAGRVPLSVVLCFSGLAGMLVSFVV